MAGTNLIDAMLNVAIITVPLITEGKDDISKIIIETVIATVVLVTLLTLQKNQTPVENVVAGLMTTLENHTVIRTIVVLAVRLLS